MNKLDRFKILINHLKSLGIIESQQDLGRKMGYNNSSAFSQVINGKTQEPKLFMQKLEELYPSLNVDWLETGEGSMLKEHAVIQAGIHTQNANGNGTITQTVNESSLINEISEMRKLVQEQVKNNQDQFNRFMTIIERLTTK